MSVRRTWNKRDRRRMIGPVRRREVRLEQDMHAVLRVPDRQQLAVRNSRRPRTTIPMSVSEEAVSESPCQCRHSVGEHFRHKASILPPAQIAKSGVATSAGHVINIWARAHTLRRKLEDFSRGTFAVCLHVSEAIPDDNRASCNIMPLNYSRHCRYQNLRSPFFGRANT
jgi:hypothetical protein